MRAFFSPFPKCSIFLGQLLLSSKVLGIVVLNVDRIHVPTVDDQPSTLMHILARYVKNRRLDQAHLYGHQESIKHCLPSQCPSS